MKKVVIIAVLMTLFAMPNLQAQSLDIRYLFIYNFTKHIKWQQLSDQEEFVIGIYNHPETLKFFQEKVSSGHRTVQGKRIKVIAVTNKNLASQCNIVYAPSSNKQMVQSFVKQCQFPDTLLVTDDELVEFGAHISFVIEGNKMHYLIKRSSIEQLGMKVSSQLISLGTEV